MVSKVRKPLVVHGKQVLALVSARSAQALNTVAQQQLGTFLPMAPHSCINNLIVLGLMAALYVAQARTRPPRHQAL